MVFQYQYQPYLSRVLAAGEIWGLLRTLEAEPVCTVELPKEMFQSIICAHSEGGRNTGLRVRFSQIVFFTGESEKLLTQLYIVKN